MLWGIHKATILRGEGGYPLRYLYKVGSHTLYQYDYLYKATMAAE